jgi:hypothetical protein
VHEATYGKEIAYTNMFQRCYWDYWRVYTAPDSQLLNASVQYVPGDFLLSGNNWQGDLDLSSDLPGLGMIAGLQIVPTNATRQIVLDLALSPEILIYRAGTIEYYLNLYKQLGLTEIPVEIRMTIPAKSQFIDLPPGAQVDQNTAVFKATLTKNNKFHKYSFSR